LSEFELVDPAFKVLDEIIIELDEIISLLESWQLDEGFKYLCQLMPKSSFVQRKEKERERVQLERTFSPAKRKKQKQKQKQKHSCSPSSVKICNLVEMTMQLGISH
jgi:hypothetical protein